MLGWGKLIFLQSSRWVFHDRWLFIIFTDVLVSQEKQFDRESAAISPILSSLHSLSEPRAPLVTPSKQPLSSYPRVFCNPVSDCENPQLDHSLQDSFTDPVSSFMTSTRNHQGSPIEDASPNLRNRPSSLSCLKLAVRPGHIIHNPEPNPNPNRKTRTRPVMDPSKYLIGFDMLIIWLSGTVWFNLKPESESKITEVYVLCT